MHARETNQFLYHYVSVFCGTFTSAVEKDVNHDICWSTIECFMHTSVEINITSFISSFWICTKLNISTSHRLELSISFIVQCTGLFFIVWTWFISDCCCFEYFDSSGLHDVLVPAFLFSQWLTASSGDVGKLSSIIPLFPLCTIDPFLVGSSTFFKGSVY